MPKLKESPVQRMERVFRAAIQYGLARKGQDMNDLVQMAPKSRSTVYNRLRNPSGCTFDEMLLFYKQFFNDQQLCEMFGVEYHGSTQA